MQPNSQPQGLAQQRPAVSVPNAAHHGRSAPSPAQNTSLDLDEEMLRPHKSKEQDVQKKVSHAKSYKEPHPTGHAGLVGFVTFLVIGGLLLAPVIPGTIWNNAPGSSQSFSTGDQAIDCPEGSPTNVKTTTSYDSKNGSPLVYQYTTTTSMSGNCASQAQHATTGHTSEFSPLALAIDLLLAIAIAVVTSKLWRRFRGVRD
jgi:hypothetical protein